MEAAVTVIFFSFVQSLFGMGLLVFGTPTLLLLGFEFSEILATLLPASIVISLFQLYEDKLVDGRFARQFIVWCLPALGVGLVALLKFGAAISLELALGTIMLLSVCCQVLPRYSVKTNGMIRHHLKAWFVIMGVVHGISNLGGSVLALVTNSCFREKSEIRRTIAFCYFCFACIQLIILYNFKPEIFTWSQVYLMALAGAVYVALGRRTFASLQQAAFEKLFLAFMFGYGVVLVSKAFA
ncbi:sulfite exporter TauE/SafE family protein [Rhizobiales bacterium]|uniref:TSUP family transporter n=1 Tax=Hongsoonwoonella zoysiae TaxID=2821844 RepID=UPI00156051C8|nr:TSUP family transporter [Hongsoonwoonella zoysiae]NRG18655.1 sulfite exporter TauE/SafE family protein [Hongsoonwoonella zoysiae]